MSASSPRLFGTDGIRAPFGEPPLDRETVVAVGFHLGQSLAAALPAPLVALGGDTRDSTETLCRWLAGGLCAGGARVTYLGTLPTPGVAWAVRSLGAAAGVAVSASHNPWPDNGIKLFDAAGGKWPSEDEAALERRLALGAPAVEPPALAVERAGRDAYLALLGGLLPGPRPLAGLRVVLDTAHGATFEIAPRLFAHYGAEVHTLGDAPDGRNINQAVGSTHPQLLQRTVRERKAQLGIAFDGDGDRAILVDERGEERDGDAMLFLWATALRSAGELDPPAVVATSMSNLGLERALSGHGIAVVRCDVGDRAVVATMRRRGIPLGGEQSGHLVHTATTSTGDGLVTGLTLAGLVASSRRPLSTLLADFRRFPQILRNVRVREKRPFGELPAVVAAQREVEAELGSEGRLVLRYSGTEPLARIMIEGPEQEVLERQAARLETALREAVGS